MAESYDRVVLDLSAGVERTVQTLAAAAGTGTDISGNAIVRTNTAELALATPRPLPTGSNLLLQTIGRPIPFLAASAQQHTLALAPRWEALHDALRINIPGQALSLTAVPRPGAQFTGALLFFIAALRAGNLRGWLGSETSRTLEREALFGRMVEEFGVMQRIASEPAGQDWRLFLLPVLSDALLHQMRLFIRDNQEGGDSDEKSQETRFVIEVTFSKLGPFQFDGLARPKALDLMIRTEREIAATMQQEIVEIFTDTTSASESVRRLYVGLQSFRSMSRMDASLMKASALRLRFSQSLASRRQRLSPAMVRSTTQRLGWTTKPFTRSDRLTISVSRSGRMPARAR